MRKVSAFSYGFGGRDKTSLSTVTTLLHCQIFEKGDHKTGTKMGTVAGKGPNT